MVSSRKGCATTVKSSFSFHLGSAASSIVSRWYVSPSCFVKSGASFGHGHAYPWTKPQSHESSLDSSVTSRTGTTLTNVRGNSERRMSSASSIDRMYWSGAWALSPLQAWQRSLPPMKIVTIFQSPSKLIDPSALILFTSARAWPGMSAAMAPETATFNRADSEFWSPVCVCVCVCYGRVCTVRVYLGQCSHHAQQG